MPAATKPPGASLYKGLGRAARKKLTKKPKALPTAGAAKVLAQPKQKLKKQHKQLEKQAARKRKLDELGAEPKAGTVTRKDMKKARERSLANTRKKSTREAVARATQTLLRRTTPNKPERVPKGALPPGATKVLDEIHGAPSRVPRGGVAPGARFVLGKTTKTDKALLARSQVIRRTAQTAKLEARRQRDNEIAKRIGAKATPGLAVVHTPVTEAAIEAYRTKVREAQKQGIDPKPAVKEVGKVANEVIKFIDRPVHGLARGSISALDQWQHGRLPDVKQTGDEFLRGLVEDPDRQPLFSDVLEKAGVTNKTLQAIGGFTLDVVLNPATWITAGAEPVVAKGAVAAARVAEKKALKQGLSKTQATRFAEMAARRHIANAKAAGKTNRGIQVGVGVGKRRLSTSGKATAAASRKLGVSKAAKVLKEGPESAGKGLTKDTHVLDPIGRVTSKVAQRTKHVSPTFREKGVDPGPRLRVRAADPKLQARIDTLAGKTDAESVALRKALIKQRDEIPRKRIEVTDINKEFHRAGAEARGVQSRAMEDLVDTAIGFQKHFKDHYVRIIDAIEADAVKALPPDLRGAANELIARWKYVHRTERAAGLASKGRPNYVPHILKDDLSGEFENVPRLKGGKLGSSERRKYEETLAEHREVSPDKFSEDVPEIMIHREEPSLTARANARIAETAMREGKPLRPGTEVGEGEAVYRLDHGRGVEVTDPQAIEAARLRTKQGYVNTAKANVKAANAEIRKLRAELRKKNPDLDAKLKALQGKTGKAANAQRRLLKKRLDAKDPRIGKIQERVAGDRAVVAGKGEGQYVVLHKSLLKREVYDDKAMPPGLREFSRFQGHWKASATLWSPTFHGRNQIGDIWKLHNEASASEMAMGWARYWVSTRRSAQRIAEAERMGVLSGGQAAELRQILGKTGQMSRIGRFTRYARKGSGARENANRLLAFDIFRRRGDSLEEAAENVRTLLIDYNTRTRFERTWVKHVLPFYIFAFRNLPQQVKYLAKRPGRFANVGLLAEEGAKAAGLPADWMDHLEEYEKNGFPIPAFGLKDSQGNPVLGTGALPLTDLNKLNPLALVETFMASATPLLKLPVELWGSGPGGYSFFYKDKIDKGGYVRDPVTGERKWVQSKNNAPAILGVILPPTLRKELGLELLTDQKTGAKVWKWDAEADYIAKQVPAISFVLQMLSPAQNQRGQDRVLQAVNLSGMRFQPFDLEDRKINEAYDRLDVLTRTRDEMLKRGEDKTQKEVYEDVNNDISKAQHRVYRLKNRGGWAVLPKSYKPPKRGPKTTASSDPTQALIDKYSSPKPGSGDAVDKLIEKYSR